MTTTMPPGSTTTIPTPPQPPSVERQPAQPNTQTPIGIPPITNSIFYKQHSAGDYVGMVILGIISFACVATFVWAYFHSKKDGTEEISWLWNDIDGRGIPVMFGLAIGAILSGVGVFLVYQFQGNYNTPDEQPGRAKVGLDAPVNHN